jgi:chromosomal replication initiator protein
LLLEAPNEFARDWAARNFAKAIEEQLQLGTGFAWQLHFTVRPVVRAATPAATNGTIAPVVSLHANDAPAPAAVPPKLAPRNTPATGAPRTVSTASNVAQPTRKPAQAISTNRASDKPSRPVSTTAGQSARDFAPTSAGGISSGLRPHFTFETFIVGPSNQLAHAAATSMVTPGGKRFNPLFLFGPSGLGKTHLANAIGHQYLTHNPDAQIVYLSAEQFTNEFINAVQNRGMDEFRTRYRTQCDALLIDDIQFLAGKEQTLDEFFHTFNALIQRDKPIVLTSDVVPQDLRGMPDRLVSRFASGMVAEVYPPELETRVAILRKKATIEGMALDDEAAFLLANTVTTNMRELEGALMKLSIQASIAKLTVIDGAMVRSALRIPTKHQVMTVEDVQRAACNYFRLTMSQLTGKERHAEVARARQIAMYIVRDRLGTSFPQIGAKFGGKDHTTVISSVQKIKALLEAKDASVQTDIDNVLAKLGS